MISFVDGRELGDFVLKLFVSGMCGALVGWEREAREKAAGLRTHTLLAMGACLFMILSMNIAKTSDADPMRAVQGLLTGLGFLAGGVIFREGTSVKGLTTAVGMWILGAIGLAVGMGKYAEAILATFFVYVVMDLVARTEKRKRTPPDLPARSKDDPEQRKP